MGVTKDNKKQNSWFTQVITSAVVLTAVVSISVWFYDNYLVTPKLIYLSTDDTDTFSVEDKFNGISIRLHPQMLIKYKEYIVLCVYLEGYYEYEFLSMTENSVTFTKTRQEYCNSLLFWVRQHIIDELRAQLGDEASKEIEGDLEVFPSIVGGVSYKNRRGKELVKYCIVEQNEIFLEYGEESQEISNRLHEYKFTLGDDPELIKTNPYAQNIVQAVVETIGQNYGAI